MDPQGRASSDSIQKLESQYLTLSHMWSDAVEVITSLDRQCNVLAHNQAKYADIVLMLETRLDTISKGFTACCSVLDIVKKNNILTPFEERLTVVEERQLALANTIIDIEEKQAVANDMIADLESRLVRQDTKVEQTYTLLTGAYTIAAVAAIAFASATFN